MPRGIIPETTPEIDAAIARGKVALKAATPAPIPLDRVTTKTIGAMAEARYKVNNTNIEYVDSPIVRVFGMLGQAIGKIFQ